MGLGCSPRGPRRGPWLGGAGPTGQPTVADARRSLADTMLRHLRATDAMKNFSEFRQEASMLHALQHPCIVSLIGISIHPLCFALELAPLGSLNTVLSENAKGTGPAENVPERVAQDLAPTASRLARAAGPPPAGPHPRVTKAPAPGLNRCGGAIGAGDTRTAKSAPGPRSWFLGVIQGPLLPDLIV